MKKLTGLMVILSLLTGCGGWDDGCEQPPADIPKLVGPPPPVAPGSENWPIYNSPEAPKCAAPAP